MQALFRFSNRFFTKPSFPVAKALGFASLFCLERIYNYQQTVRAYSPTPFDAKLKEQFQRNIPVLDNFFSNVVLLTGNANPELAEEIAKILGVKLGDCQVGRFSDGEVSIMPTCTPVNENLMELLLLVSTLRRASARKINVLVPYYGYSRQDRKTSARVPISAADVARLLETVGVDRVISIDLHCGQIQGFFGPRVPVDNLEANAVALNYFITQTNIDFRNTVIVSPDAGGVARAKKFQELFNKKTNLDCSLAMIIKQREGAGKIAQMNLVGSVEGKNAIIIDDMIDTAGTLCEAAKTLKNFGASSVSSFATHGLFSGNALNNIKSSVLENIVVTNTIPKKAGEEAIDKITRLSVGKLTAINELGGMGGIIVGRKQSEQGRTPILAETIYRVQKKQSVADLFNSKPEGQQKDQ